MTDPAPRTYLFGGFTLEAAERRLLGQDGAVIPLRPRAFATLLHLVERAGHLVTKEQLLAEIWPDAVVEESNLAKNVWLVRRALAEPEGEARFIETVPRIGYRFVAPVETLRPELAAGPGDAGADVPGAGAASRPASRGERRRTVALAAGAGLAVAALLAVWAGSARAPARRRDPSPARTPMGAETAAPATEPSRPTASGAPTASGTPAASAAAAAAAVPAPPLHPRPAVALLGFEDLSRHGDSAWLARALAEMMSADLAAGEKLRLVPGADAMRLAGTLPREPGALPLDALARARGQLAADFVVKGSYVTLPSPQGEILRLDVLLQSTASGDTVATASTTGASHRLFALVDGAATQLRFKLGLEPPPMAAAAAAAAALPARPEATQLYAEGLEKLRRYDALGARPLLERVIALEPRFPLAHLALSQAVAALGYDRVAVDEAKRALALAGRLTREQQLAIAAALAEARKDWNAATTTNRSLFQFFPDNLDYGLSLARTLVAGGRAAEAQGVVAALQRRPAPAGEDPRLDLAAAAASEALSDWQRQLASARLAARKARAEQRTWLLGKALLSEAGAAGALGQAQAARDGQREAARIFHDLGDAGAEADTLVGIANDLGSRGDVEGALAGYRRALATFERCGNRKGAAHVWSDIANSTWLRGNVEETLRAGRRELALSREIDDRRGIVWGLGALGNVLADQGAIDEALRMQTEGLAISREIGDRQYTGFCLAAIADTHFTAGDLEQAWRGYGEALELDRRLQNVFGIAGLEDDLGSVLLAEDRLDEAARQFQAALDTRERMDDRDEAAQSRINLAQVRNEQGRPAEGLALARRSLQDFTAMHQSGNTALALAVGALAEIGLHRNAPALADCGRAREALRGNRQNQANLFVLLAQARAEAAAGHPAAARAAAAAALAMASGAHALASALEARLVLGELDLRERPAAGVPALRALAREARAKRFLLLARRADGLLAGR